jgi:uncharacterized protein DUF898
MATFDATVPAAQIGSVASSAGVVRFRGEARRFWQLLARGAVLLMCTLGIYRFWLTTDIRRYLWSNTELAGESFEYTGTARELLLGFLIAIAILVPLYAGFFLLALSLGELSSLIALMILTLLGHYAVYRARRYRLTRTVYRGVRFHQSGSASAAIVIPGAYLLPRLTGELDSMAKEIMMTAAGLAAYVAIALGYSTIYQATVRLDLWRCVVETLDISNPAVLEQVRAAGQPASPVGEGLADALSVGGI